MSDSRAVSTLLYLQEKAENGFVDFAEATREWISCFRMTIPSIFILMESIGEKYTKCNAV